MDYNLRDSLYRNKLLVLSEKIHNSTVQLFTIMHLSIPKALGSGVLLYTNKKYLILSASHVAEEKPCYILAKNELKLITGDCIQVGREHTGKIDLGYFIIDNETANFLGEDYKFLTDKDILISYKSPENMLNYMVTGYLEETTKINSKENVIHTSAYSFNLKIANERVYKFYDINSNYQIALDFKGKLENYKSSQNEKIPDPYGLSGSGVWGLIQRPGSLKYEIECKLIGIMTELRKGKYYCLIGNKIEVLVESIERQEKIKINTSKVKNL